jgi:very-short-patch-repair endonuclease
MTTPSHVQRLAQIAQIASVQHGVIARHQLHSLDWSSSGIQSLVERGYLHALHPGTWAVGHPGISYEGRVMAAVLASGPGAAASARCAAHLMRIDPLGSQTVEVVTPHRHRPLDGVVGHSSRFLPRSNLTTFNRIPITTSTRTFVDLADVVDPLRLVRCMHEARFRGLFDLRAVRRGERRHQHRRGHPVLVRALELHLKGSQGSASNAELRFVRRLVARGIPEPLVGIKVNGSNDRYSLDCWWPDLQLNAELDDHTHDRPANRKRDKERDADLRAVGIEIIRVHEDWIDPGIERVAARFGLA